jgi:Holliday junction resolvase RusA-like endonuclease
VQGSGETGPRVLQVVSVLDGALRGIEEINWGGCGMIFAFIKIPGPAHSKSGALENGKYQLSRGTREYKWKIEKLIRKQVSGKSRHQLQEEMQRGAQFEVEIKVFENYLIEDRHRRKIMYLSTSGDQIADLDHISSLILDAFSGIVYYDDVQVVSLGVRRVQSTENEVQIGIWEAECLQP